MGRATVPAMVLLWVAVFAASLMLAGRPAGSAQRFTLAQGSAATPANASVSVSAPKTPTVVGVTAVPALPALKLPRTVHRSAAKPTAPTQVATVTSPASAPTRAAPIQRSPVRIVTPAVTTPAVTTPAPAPAPKPSPPAKPTGTGTVSGGG